MSQSPLMVSWRAHRLDKRSSRSGLNGVIDQELVYDSLETAHRSRKERKSASKRLDRQVQPWRQSSAGLLLHLRLALFGLRQQVVYRDSNSMAPVLEFEKFRELLARLCFIKLRRSPALSARKPSRESLYR